MDKLNKPHSATDLKENVNGLLTNESFNEYSTLSSPKKVSLKKILITFLIISLLFVSVFIFIKSIEKAFFNQTEEKENSNLNIRTVKTEILSGELIETENVSPEVSVLFNIPVGVKIVNVDETCPIFTGLMKNDIIVEISGKRVQNVDELNSLVEKMDDTDSVVYKIYREGKYISVDPSDDYVADH